MAPHDRIRLKDEFQTVLAGAVLERPARGAEVFANGKRELGWVVFERERMLAAVNKERGRRGLPRLAVGDVERVERLAVGHSDYVSKFALYCAELALGE